MDRCEGDTNTGARFLVRGMSYPVTRDQLIARAQLEAINLDTIDVLERLPDREWDNEADLIRDFEATR